MKQIVLKKEIDFVAGVIAVVGDKVGIVVSNNGRLSGNIYFSIVFSDSAQSPFFESIESLEQYHYRISSHVELYQLPKMERIILNTCDKTIGIDDVDNERGILVRMGSKTGFVFNGMESGFSCNKSGWHIKWTDNAGGRSTFYQTLDELIEKRIEIGNKLYQL